MKYEIFTINMHDSDTTKLNRFLSSHRIINVKKSLVTEENSSFWSFLIEYAEREQAMKSDFSNKSPKVDYREILSETDFAKFSVLRDLRKSTAEKRGIQVYNVFTNAQLAEMITDRIVTKDGLGKIAGVGTSKQEKFGEAFLKALQELFNEENRQFV